MGGFIGERESENVFARNLPGRHEVRDAVGHRAGLSAARSGEDEKRSVSVQDGLALIRIQFVQVETHSRWELTKMNARRDPFKKDLAFL